MKLLKKNKSVRRLMLPTADIISFMAVSVAVRMLLPGDTGVSDAVFLGGTATLGVCIFVFQVAFRTYDSLWRYAKAQEYMTLFLGTLCGYAAYLGINAFVLRQHYVSAFYMLVVSLCSFIVYLGIRLLLRFLRNGKACSKGSENIKYIAVIGAGNAGELLYNEIRRNKKSPHKLWCFIDDDAEIIGKRLHGARICGPINDMSAILKDSPVSEVILAIPSLDDKRRREIIELCSALPYRLKLLPESVLNDDKESGNISASVRDVKPDDLLGRSSVSLNSNEIKAFLKNKVVLVTGGGGSIGSELCRQVAGYGPKKLIIFDMFENSAYILQKDLEHIYGVGLDFQVEIGSIRDERRLRSVLERYRPEIVFHAAAYKHVPLMEHSPGEAVKNNIFPTFNLLKLAPLYGCEKFVMISTDKAVNPTNVMGATKRYCEMMMQAVSESTDCGTEFVAVRFGNVLGSNGSVVPLFMNQIAKGGPVTITDKRIIRYFMTISEAVSLVLRAGAMAKKSEIYVLNMGKPVKILTLAENLIRLAGFVPYKDIEIVETGLRPGEKLYEELLIKEEESCATKSQKIFTEKQRSRASLSDIERGIKLLSEAVKTEDGDIVVAALKDLVPTFRTPEEVNSCVKAITELQGAVSQSA